MTQPAFQPLRVAVATASDTRTVDTDASGRLIQDALTGAGHSVVDYQVVPDELVRVRALVAGWVADAEVQVVIVTGGTGVTARDITPEALAPLVTKTIDGFGELFRWLSFREIGASTIQSRAFAALCTKTLVFALPGSTGAVRLAMSEIIVPQLDARTRPCNFAELIPRM